MKVRHENHISGLKCLRFTILNMYLILIANTTNKSRKKTEQEVRWHDFGSYLKFNGDGRAPAVRFKLQHWSIERSSAMKKLDFVKRRFLVLPFCHI